VALFRRKTFFLPDILIAIVINVIAAVLVYYATLVWALYRLQLVAKHFCRRRSRVRGGSDMMGSMRAAGRVTLIFPFNCR